ncbi:MAG: aminoacyl-tRNA hydrolase [Actinobacteria bacterium]|nr:aminoacyl-tRNA hydrolase [Actinomycetota bacterium]
MRLFRRTSDPGDRSLVVGLGNPGERYARTRHNAGAMVIDELLGRTDARLKSHKSGCLIAEVALGGKRAVLARPTTYMNESGRQVRELARWYKLDASDIIVVHDEIDLPFGEIRIKSGGGIAGHNGLSSILNHLSTKDFTRVRVGVGRPRGEGVEHVLGEFSGAQRKELPDVIARAADATERILEAGVERAMNETNTRA